MTKFEIGDKVKFLNQVGGGVVTKVTDDFVFVQDDTGFDMPMTPDQLIRMADQQGAAKMFNATMEEHLKGKGTPLPSVFDATSKAAAALKKAVPLTPEEEIKQLKNQIANLKDQVARLKKQLSAVQQQNSRALSDNILLQHETAPGEAEVDLHIDMLSERPADLTAHEAFEIQMHYFRLCMNHAFTNNMKKVTFIHGVGKGILKDEINKELKQYDNVHFFDAPLSKYGVGATEVYFK
ncbi:MAG: Smr/MutS family protein [Bacteroidales bacterium]|nr:Smr/MutS family protein [Bacteroidales bacterium]